MDELPLLELALGALLWLDAGDEVELDGGLRVEDAARVSEPDALCVVSLAADVEVVEAAADAAACVVARK